jgi:hypothetical protein
MSRTWATEATPSVIKGPRRDRPALYHRFLERIVARVLVTTLWQIGYTVKKTPASGQTKPDESYKKEKCFHRPERVRIRWGD